MDETDERDRTGAGDEQGHGGRQRSGWAVVVGALLAVIGAVGFVWAYLAPASAAWEGGMLALAFGGIGLALAYWGRYMAGDRPAQDRYPIPSHDQDAADDLAGELESDAAVLTRRRFLTALLVGGAGVVGLSQLVLAGSFGPRPRNSLFVTSWTPGARLVTVDGRPITTDALSSGGMLVAFPEGHTQAADSQVVLLRLDKAGFRPQPGREDWSPQGFVAYSRVCTHAGCAVGQYEDEQHLLLCPCHQSTFDVLDGARPVSGPAGRALPQLPLAVNGAGELVARSDFTEAVGPGFWDLPWGSDR